MPLLTNSKVDELGDRIRCDKDISKQDINLLNKFRVTYQSVEQQVLPIVQVSLSKNKVILTQRKRKTVNSIQHKLERFPKMRLSQMQDIAGCRVVVEATQIHTNTITELLSATLKKSECNIKIIPRDTELGYRATHFIVKVDKRFYEIQLRTYAQDIWANVVESLSKQDNGLKYGENISQATLQKKLKHLSEVLYKIDAQNLPFAKLNKLIYDTLNNVFRSRA